MSGLSKGAAEPDDPRSFLPDRPPTEEEIEIAKEEARKRGWLTDAGWIWDEPDSSEQRDDG